LKRSSSSGQTHLGFLCFPIYASWPFASYIAAFSRIEIPSSSLYIFKEDEGLNSFIFGRLNKEAEGIGFITGN